MFFTNKNRNLGGNIQKFESIDNRFFVFQKSHNMIYITPLILLHIFEQMSNPEICQCSLRRNTSKSHLVSNVCQSFDKSIQNIINQSVSNSSRNLLFLEKNRWQIFHQIIHKNTNSSVCRKSPSTIIWLKNESHFLKRSHIIANCGTRNSKIISIKQ